MVVAVVDNSTDGSTGNDNGTDGTGTRRTTASSGSHNDSGSGSGSDRRIDEIVVVAAGRHRGTSIFHLHGIPEPARTRFCSSL